MKKQYEAPVAEIVLFEVEDVIMASTLGIFNINLMYDQDGNVIQ